MKQITDMTIDELLIRMKNIAIDESDGYCDRCCKMINEGRCPGCGCQHAWLLRYHPEIGHPSGVEYIVNFYLREKIGANDNGDVLCYPHRYYVRDIIKFINEHETR